MDVLKMQNIKLSGFADEISGDLNEQMRVLKKLDMKYVEMRGVNGKGLVDYELADVENIKKQLDANGINLSSIGSPIGKMPITEDFGKHFELFKHTVDIAHLMDVKNIRMFSFFMPREEETSKYRDEVFKRTGEMVDYAIRNGVVLLHENEKEIYGDVASRCLGLMEEFYCDNYRAVFDFANFVQCRQDTLEAYEMLKPFIDYVHVKDALWESGQVVPAGYGDGNVKDILERLFESGYEGFLSLEPHLSDFTGFSSLERGEHKENKKLSGEEAFTLAHDSLIKILNDI